MSYFTPYDPPQLDEYQNFNQQQPQQNNQIPVDKNLAMLYVVKLLDEYDQNINTSSFNPYTDKIIMKISDEQHIEIPQNVVMEVINKRNKQISKSSNPHSSSKVKNECLCENCEWNYYVIRMTFWIILMTIIILIVIYSCGLIK